MTEKAEGEEIKAFLTDYDHDSAAKAKDLP
jgi:hypothetical protein